MESNQFETRQRKSMRLTILRIAMAAAIIVAGLGATAYGWQRQEASAKAICEDNPMRNMRQGDYASITTNEYYFAYETTDPVTYIYFAFTGDDEYYEEVVVVQSRHDYRGDTEETVRTFKGILHFNPENEREYEAEILAHWFEIDEAFAFDWMPELYMSHIRPGVDFKWLAGAGVLGGFLLVLQVLVLVNGKKIRRRMEAFDVDDIAIGRFEQELDSGRGETFGKITLTDNWVFNGTTGAVALLPLREIVWVYQKVTSHSVNFIPTGKTFAVELYFSDGGHISLPCKKSDDVEQAMEAIARRCPQALLGFSDERAKVWAKDKEQVIRASRERAAELVNADEFEYEEPQGEYAPEEEHTEE